MNVWIYAINKSKKYSLQNQRSQFSQIKMNIDQITEVQKQDGKKKLHEMVQEMYGKAVDKEIVD